VHDATTSYVAGLGPEDLDRIVEECKGDLKIATASLVAFEQAVDNLITGR
jgi:hypothetical protein